MKTNKKILSTVLALIVAVGVIATVIIVTSNKTMAQTLNDNVTEMMGNIENGASTDLQTQLSSNPYDYSKNNKHFDKIVAMGYKVLPVIEKYINDSPNDGLAEYLLAIAAEKIAKIDLKNSTDGKKYNWQTAKGFTVELDKYLKKIPDSVNTILSSKNSQDEKISALKELGVPSVPFIMDQFNNSDAEQQQVLTTSLIELLQDDENLNIGINSDIKSWIGDNKDKFKGLKDYIESK